jgi:hypothetical protein
MVEGGKQTQKKSPSPNPLIKNLSYFYNNKTINRTSPSNKQVIVNNFPNNVLDLEQILFNFNEILFSLLFYFHDTQRPLCYTIVEPLTCR